MDEQVASPLFRPMLAATVKDIHKLRLPLLASPKLDGFRATGHNGVAFSRSMKRLPNRHVQELYSSGRLNRLDAELMAGDPLDKDAFNKAQSGLGKVDGIRDFSVHVFDDFTYQGAAFKLRYADAAERVRILTIGEPRIQLVPQIPVTSLERLAEVEAGFLGMGYEGVMLRHEGSPYKQGRGTFTAHDLMKLKQFEDGEAIIIGFEELQRNDNEAVTNEIGLTSRSTSKEGKYGGGTLGALHVRAINGPFEGAEFYIGSGFTAKQRQDIWNMREVWLGVLITYKWFKIGSINAPRFPVFKGRRSLLDMS